MTYRSDLRALGRDRATKYDIAELTWKDKPVDQLTREELVELVGVLHDMVWRSSENFERLLRSQRKLTLTGARV